MHDGTPSKTQLASLSLGTNNTIPIITPKASWNRKDKSTYALK